MICTFFGHKNTQSNIKIELEKTINDLIKKGIKNYYVGNNENFDYMVQSILMKKKLKNIVMTINLILLVNWKM